MKDEEIKYKLDKKITGIIAFRKKVETQIESKKDELHNLESQKILADGRLQSMKDIYLDFVGDEYNEL